MSSNAKKIGLIACTGVVAGNMMGSGIALLPSSLASVGSVSIFSWLICLVGALSLAFVYARLATKTHKNVVQSLMLASVSGIWFQTGVLIPR
ncbi:putative cadaverine/lysine antiporter CadB, partial [Vibrio alginolyticus 12G01]